MPKRSCAFKHGCHYPARYLMNWVDEDGTRHSGYVCNRHDKYLGRGNLAEALGISIQEAVGLDMAMRKESKP